MESAWKRNFLSSLAQRGIHAPDPEAYPDAWLQVYDELRRAPAGTRICWYTITVPEAEHVYSDWLDIYVALPPGRVPAPGGVNDLGDKSCLWMAVEPGAESTESWSPGARVFGTTLVLEPDVDLWSLVPRESLPGEDAVTEEQRRAVERFTVASCVPGWPVLGPPVVVPLGQAPSGAALRHLEAAAAATGREITVRGAWSLGGINQALSTWCTELLGRPDLSFGCWDCEAHH